VVRQTREPGGTVLGEALRELLLRESMSVDTEALLMFAARREHIVQVIEPALAAGQWVLCDRFTDASFAYQGGGRGLSTERLQALEAWTQQGLQPDLTLLFDLSPDKARERRSGARRPDKFEREDEAFFERVRDSYLARAASSRGRIAIVDSANTVEAIHTKLSDLLDALCDADKPLPRPAEGAQRSELT
jgi:dTMP kinase